MAVTLSSLVRSMAVLLPTILVVSIAALPDGFATNTSGSGGPPLQPGSVTVNTPTVSRQY